MNKLLIADDHPIVIDGLRKALNQDPDWEIAGEAKNGKEVLQALSEEKIDLILLDVSMPDMNGIEACQRIKAEYPHVKVLAFTLHQEKTFISRMLAAGVDGYLLKTTPHNQLVEGIRNTLKGHKVYSPEVTQVVMESFNKAQANPTAEVTPREMEVLKLLAEEYTTSEIADKLHLSKHTVESHRKNMLGKFNVKNSVGLIRYALEHGLI
ncbi:MAG: response regulator transcription factor [Bacteroidota bacterium]